MSGPRDMRGRSRVGAPCSQSYRGDSAIRSLYGHGRAVGSDEDCEMTSSQTTRLVGNLHRRRSRRARAHRVDRRFARRWSVCTSTRRPRSISSSRRCSRSARSSCAARRTRSRCSPRGRAARRRVHRERRQHGAGRRVGRARARRAVHGDHAGQRAAHEGGRGRRDSAPRSCYVPYEEWWQTLVDHGRDGMRGHVHPSRRRSRGDGGQRDDRSRDR